MVVYGAFRGTEMKVLYSTRAVAQRIADQLNNANAFKHGTRYVVVPLTVKDN